MCDTHAECCHFMSLVNPTRAPAQDHPYPPVCAYSTYFGYITAPFYIGMKDELDPAKVCSG